MKRLTFLLLSCALLSSCKVHLPVIHECYISNDPFLAKAPGEAKLFPNQIEPLEDWFDSIETEWSFQLSDHYPSGTNIILVSKNGKTTVANLRGNELWVRNYFTTLTPSEQGQLLEIMDPQNQIPVFKKEP